MLLELLFKLFITFFEIGLFTFGGGYAMIPLIQQNVVENGWMTLPELIDFIAIGEATPGPFAVNIATFVGSETAGLIGSVCATLGVILPSFIIILFIAKFFADFKDNFFVKSALVGLRPAVVALILAAAYAIAVSTLFNFEAESMAGFFDWKAIVIFAIIIGLRIKFKKLHPAIFILISAVLGVILYGFI